jgi:hypothetical protein
VEKHVKQWTKPRTELLIVGTVADVTRSRGELIAEKDVLAIVKPDTLLGWHRQGFRLYC